MADTERLFRAKSSNVALNLAPSPARAASRPWADNGGIARQVVAGKSALASRRWQVGAGKSALASRRWQVGAATSSLRSSRRSVVVPIRFWSARQLNKRHMVPNVGQKYCGLSRGE
jgi:hypothetical protein